MCVLLLREQLQNHFTNCYKVLSIWNYNKNRHNHSHLQSIYVSDLSSLSDLAKSYEVQLRQTEIHTVVEERAHSINGFNWLCHHISSLTDELLEKSKVCEVLDSQKCIILKYNSSFCTSFTMTQFTEGFLIVAAPVTPKLHHMVPFRFALHLH